VLGPGGGDIQPALAAVAQQRPPLVPHPAVRMLAVANGQDDRVPLVALDAFQVLDEEGFGRIVGEEHLDVRLDRFERRAQRQIDPFGVPDAERDDAQRLLRAAAGVLEDQFHHLVHLGRDRGLLAGPAVLLDHDVLQAVVTEHTGEGGQGAAVDALVGERHQPFVPAAVVPVQRGRRQQRPERVQHRLEARPERHRLLVVVLRVHVAELPEETGRRQLVVVPGHHHLVRPYHRGDRVGGHDLAGLVEDHHVEQPGGG